MLSIHVTGADDERLKQRKSTGTGEKALENTVRQQAKNLTHIGTELVNG